MSTGGFQAAGRGAAANRLPTAPRERKPALAALAVLLILAGALSTMLLVNRSGNRISVIKVVQTVGAGDVIKAEDVTEASVAADSSISYVLYSQLNAVVGHKAGVTLVPDTILVANMLRFGAAAGLPAGQSEIGVNVRSGHYPTGGLKAAAARRRRARPPRSPPGPSSASTPASR